MHYYQHHIGDFIKATARLTDAQAMAYLRLIWMYYDDEKPLVDDPEILSLKIGASKEDVALLLRAYFTPIGGLWHHHRCDEEIAAYHAMAEAGKRGAAKRWAKGGDKEAISHPTATPIATSNQEPRTKNQDNPPKPPKGGGQRFEEFWTAWPKSERKQDKAKCAEKWKTRNLDAEADRILADIATKKQTQKWQGGFIEAPEVYLNNRRWEDGVTPDDPLGSPSITDPDSKAAIEAEGVRLGVGKWTGTEQWPAYMARVRAAQGVTA